MAVNYWIRTDGVKRSLTVLRPRIRRYQKFIQRTFSTQKSEKQIKSAFAIRKLLDKNLLTVIHSSVIVYVVLKTVINIQYLSYDPRAFIHIHCLASIEYRI